MCCTAVQDAYKSTADLVIIATPHNNQKSLSSNTSSFTQPADMESILQNKAAFLDEPGAPLIVRDAPFPRAGSGEIVVRNAAIAVNPVDWHMQDSGMFVKQWPAVIGCDVAGEVYETGPDVDLFKIGDRVIG